jgi:hypothetical protein
MVALFARGATEITFGCRQKGTSFVAMFADRNEAPQVFFRLVSLAGEALTKTRADDILDAAQRCVAIATADRLGYGRFSLDKTTTFDCAAGPNFPLNTKVSIEHAQ